MPEYTPEQKQAMQAMFKDVLDEWKADKEKDPDDKADVLLEEKFRKTMYADLAAKGIITLDENGEPRKKDVSNNDIPPRKDGFDGSEPSPGNQDPRITKSVQKILAKRAKEKMLEDSTALSRFHSDDMVRGIEEFKLYHDAVWLGAHILHEKRKKSDGAPLIQVLKSMDHFNFLQSMLGGNAELRKAMSAGTAASGAEWIPTGFSSRLFERINLLLSVAAMFETINMPNNPYTLPVQKGAASGFLVAESTNDTGTSKPTSTPTTGNFTFDAIKLAGRVLVSEEMTEDSIIAVLDFIERELALSIAEARENAIINGDTSGTHQDSDVTAATDARKAFPGLRYLALNNAGTATQSFANAALTLAALRTLRFKLGKYGKNPVDLGWITGINSYYQMFNLAEFKTMDLVGNRATVIQGQVGEIDGIPVICSEHMREDLAADGMHDGVTEDRTGVLCVYKPGFKNGLRKEMQLDSDVNIVTDQITIIGKQRIDFKDPYDATDANNIHVVYGYNVAKV